jgi:hypothetical protein
MKLTPEEEKIMTTKERARLKTTEHLWDIDEIKAANRRAGQFFFSPDTMRFWNSRVLPDVYQGPGGVYFITSERFDAKAPRLYTVRRFYPETGSIKTVGGFYGMSRPEAVREAVRFARG